MARTALRALVAVAETPALRIFVFMTFFEFGPLGAIGVQHVYFSCRAFVFQMQKYKYVCRFKKKVIEICDLWQIFCYKNISFAFCR